MNNNELYHHGVKGMKWGVRRKPKQVSVSTSNKSKDNDKEIKKLNKKSKIADEASTAMTRANKVNTTVAKIKNNKQTRQELDSMDNEQLRKRVERLNLEQQYTTLNQSRMSKGHTYVSNTLEVGASVASVTASALTVAALIKELKKA